MSWQTEMTQIVRVLVNDIDSTEFSDSRIQQLILICAPMVEQQVDFDVDYDIDIVGSSISPDPTDDTRDQNFINLVSLKSACLLYNSKVESNDGRSRSVKDAWTSITVGDNSKNVTKNSDMICEQYEQAKRDYTSGDSRSGRAILGPITNDNVYPYYGNFS